MHFIARYLRQLAILLFYCIVSVCCILCHFIAGHFTQMVWKNSKELGIGWVQKDDGTTYVVGNYDPPGNIMGQYYENVFTPFKN